VILKRPRSNSRAHMSCCLLALKVARQMGRRLRAALGTTDTRADSIPLPEALSRLCLRKICPTSPTLAFQPLPGGYAFVLGL
jgi:hypothetical protein